MVGPTNPQDSNIGRDFPPPPPVRRDGNEALQANQVSQTSPASGVTPGTQAQGANGAVPPAVSVAVQNWTLTRNNNRPGLRQAMQNQLLSEGFNIHPHPGSSGHVS